MPGSVKEAEEHVEKPDLETKCPASGKTLRLKVRHPSGSGNTQRLKAGLQCLQAGQGWDCGAGSALGPMAGMVGQVPGAGDWVSLESATH